MMRRFTAALLALVILLSAVPVLEVSAEERIYKKGETLSVAADEIIGNAFDPNGTYKTAYGYKWEPVVDKNGDLVLACIKPVHKCDFTPGGGCYNYDGTQKDSCTGNHNHSSGIGCVYGYSWIVVRDWSIALWYEDPLAPENYEFAVCCYDPDGIVPMAGVELKLFQLIEKEIDGTPKMINDPVVVSEEGESIKLVTNENGYCYFTGECKSSIPEGYYTWKLVQMSEAFQEGGTYYNQYRANSVKWEVDVHASGDGTFTVIDIRDPNAVSLMSEDEEEYPKPVEGYDAENSRLVILNQPINVVLQIDLFDVPASLAQLDVTIKGPDGFEKVVQVTKESGRWHYDTSDWEILLESGEYTVEANTGYPVVTMVNRKGEEPEEGNTLYLDKDHKNGYYEIHFASLSATVRLYAVDENGNPACGAVYGLYNEAGGKIAEVDSEGNSNAVIDSNDWKELLSEGCALTVKQLVAPENHDLADNSYQILLTETGDEVEPYAVDVSKISGDKKVAYGESNEQIATFVNKKHDLSYKIIPGAVDASGTAIETGSVYTLTQVDTETSWTVEAGATLNMKDLLEDKALEKAEFKLTQKTAPEGYLVSEDSYTVTAQVSADDTVAVEVAKDVGVLAKIAMFFTGDGIERGNFGEWKPVFACEKEPEKVIPHSNTVILRAQDSKGNGVPGAKYEIYKDGKSLDVTFAVAEDEEDTGEVTVDSKDWEDMAMKLYFSNISEEDKNALMNGSSLEVVMKQTATPEGYEAAAEEYPLEVRRSREEDGIEDKFFIKVKTASNGTVVEYKDDGTQIAAFTNREQDMSHKIIPSAVDASGTAIETGSVYTLTQVDTETSWTVEAGATLNMKDLMEVEALDEAEFTLTQKAAPEGYLLSEDSYTVTVTEGEDGAVSVDMTKDAGVLAKIAMFFTGDGIERGDFGEWKPVFACEKEPEKVIPHSNTVILRAQDSKGNGVPGAKYEIYKDGKSLDVTFAVAEDEEDTGEVTVDSKDWEDMAMKLYFSNISEEDKNALMNGSSLEVVMKQTATPEGYEAAAEEYPLEVRRSREEDGIEDKFFIKVKTASNGTVVEYKDDGTQIATFLNEEMKEEAAYVTLTLEEDVDLLWNECAEDAQFRNMSYQMGLYFGNSNTPAETITLKPGNSGAFATKIPLGQAYTVKPVQTAPMYNITFTNEAANESYKKAYTGESQVSETVALTAEISYEFLPGTSDINVTLIVCDASSTELTLEGAKFVLKDAAGNQVGEPLVTGADGKVSITGLEKSPATYTLEQTAATEGYTPLKGVVPIVVMYDYQAGLDLSGNIVAIQNLIAEAPTHIINAKEGQSAGTARIHLSLDDIKIQWNDSESDSDQREYYNDREYEFLLYWKDSTGAWQTDNEVLTLVNNSRSSSGVFKKELPVGTTYKVRPAADRVDYNVTFSGGAAKDQTREYVANVTQTGDIYLTAQIKYVLAMGDFSPSLHMVKVYARDTSKTLAGAKFTLKDEDADTLETYKTGKDGIIEITFGMLEDYPATYTLKENKAPDEYIKLKSVISINVGYQYSAEEENGTVVVYQDLVATADHPDVTLGRDGWYYIKNTHEDDNPKTGDAFEPVVWLGVLLVSGAALSYLLIDSAKKRRAR